MKRVMGRRLFILALTVASIAAPACAQERETPYWASLRYDEANMRVGPSERYPIDWVYHRKGLPVKVIRLKDGWRLVQDYEGTQGWMRSTQLHPDRSAIVVGDEATPIRSEPSGNGDLLWNVEPGVSGALGDCEEGWCFIDFSGHEGWIMQDRLWGAGEP